MALDENTARSALVLFKETKQVLVANMSSIGSGSVKDRFFVLLLFFFVCLDFQCLKNLFFFWFICVCISRRKRLRSFGRLLFCIVFRD